MHVLILNLCMHPHIIFNSFYKIDHIFISAQIFVYDLILVLVVNKL
jgi:hypothetical protein